MNPWDVEGVIVPAVNDALAETVEQGWVDLARATASIHEAVAALESSLEELATGTR
jgi:hypothetical protein